MEEQMTFEQIREAGIVETGQDGRTEMVTVRAAIDKVRDNGHTYMTGDVFHMEMSLAAAHVDAGQVELVSAGT